MSLASPVYSSISQSWELGIHFMVVKYCDKSLVKCFAKIDLTGLCVILQDKK